MRSINGLLNSVVLASIRRKRFIIMKCTKKSLEYLDLLVSMNIVEYTKEPFTYNSYKITLVYYNNTPVLKDIVFIGNNNGGYLSKDSWTSEINSRRNIYIADAPSGLVITNSLKTKVCPKRLLFKVIIN